MSCTLTCDIIVCMAGSVVSRLIGGGASEMSHYGGGGDYAQFQNRPNYDVRRVQKAFERDTIDYNASCSLHVEVKKTKTRDLLFSPMLPLAHPQNRLHVKNRGDFNLLAPHRINLFQVNYSEPALPRVFVLTNGCGSWNHRWRTQLTRR